MILLGVMADFAYSSGNTTTDNGTMTHTYINHCKLTKHGAITTNNRVPLILGPQSFLKSQNNIFNIGKNRLNTGCIANFFNPTVE